MLFVLDECENNEETPFQKKSALEKEQVKRLSLPV